ncbi:MAG: IS1595 family transposase [Nitrosotalea sp.]
MSRKRIRCSKCRKDYNPLLGSKFSTINLPYSKWLALIKLFESSVSIRSSSMKIGVSYETAWRIFHIVRRSILKEMARNDDVLRDEIKADKDIFEDRRHRVPRKIIVFGILERKKGRVRVEILKDVTARSVLNATVKKIMKGGVMYTDRWKGYDSLVFCGCKDMVNQKRFARDKVYVDEKEGFWTFACENMAKYHGVSPGMFLYYVKEMEWRYNNRGGDLFNMLVDYMLVVN